MADSTTPFAAAPEETREEVSGQHVAHHPVLPCAGLDGCYRDSKVAPGREWKEILNRSLNRPAVSNSLRKDTS